MYKLRSYQTDLINQIYRSMSQHHRVIVVQSPPRTGKTVVMAEIAKRATDKNNRVMFLIHRKEVLDQAINTFKNQGVNSDLLTAGMVQTLTRRIDKLPKQDVILVDEAHHALAKSYRNILDKYPNAIILLFTATPRRTGRLQLDQIADDIIVGQSIKELTKNGFLAPFRYYQPPDDFNSKLLKRNSTGEYTNESIDNAMSNKIYGHIVDQYKKLANGKQAVVYTYSVDSAHRIAKQFSEADISARSVSGQTSQEVRDHIVDKFRNQKLKILVNVNLFTEGVDLPNVDCVIMARPTASLSLYLQFSMRCLNPRPNKTAIIIDHANNIKHFGYPDDDRNWQNAILTGKKTNKKSNKKSEVSIITCDYCFGTFKPDEIKNGLCPFCGKKIKVAKTKEVEDVDLIEIDRKNKIKAIIEDNVMTNVLNKSVNDLNSMPELYAYAKLHGYKKGWAYYVGKKKGILK